ncbi:hypothetical protein E2C01_071576 [Portunus trituberculatus]|uniref:Uncharacterized protein n=1 Tax=Portunus trituberculatus TaxID=210409 RepID=A0A5B7HVQ0_PORTR|nr:hypothetical protein [Portunus trituberculatus]
MTSANTTGGTGVAKDNGGGSKDESGRGKRVEKQELKPLYHVARPDDKVVAARFMYPRNKVVPAIFPKFLYRDSWLMLHQLCR